MSGVSLGRVVGLVGQFAAAVVRSSGDGEC